MAILYVRNKSDHKIFHIEESFSSLVWTERYQECGDFVLEIPLNAANVDVYAIGNYLTLDDSTESMVIESRSIDDEAEEPLLEVTGRSLSSLLSRRTIMSRVIDLQQENIVLEGSIDDTIGKLFEDNITSPIIQEYAFFTDPEGRKLSEVPAGVALVEGFTPPPDPFTVYGRRQWVYYNVIRVVERPRVDRSLPITFKSSVTGIHIEQTFSEMKTVYDALVAICKKHYLGFKSYFDENNNIVVELIQGKNRSSFNNNLSPVIFNPVMDNISYVNYFDDYSECKTTGISYSDWYINYYVYAAQIKIYQGYNWVVDETKTGFDRYEIPFDVRSEVSVKSLQNDPDMELVYGESSEETVEDPRTTSEWEQYYDAIEKKVISTGESKYDDGDYEPVCTSEGAIDPLVRYKFEEDYFIGDQVELTNENGIIMTAYISEAVKSYDQNGIVVTPAFTNMTKYDTGEEE